MTSKMECELHKRRELIMVCVTCGNKLLCAECVSGHTHEHDHDLQPPWKVADNVKVWLRKMASFYGQHFDDIQQSLKDTHTAQKEQESLESQTRHKINHQRTLLNSTIDKSADYLLQICKQRKEKNLSILKDHEKSLSPQISNVTKMKTEINAVLELENDIELIYKSQSINHPEMVSLHLPALEALDFQPRDIEWKINDIVRHMPVTTPDDDVSEGLESLHLQTPATLSGSHNLASDFEGTIKWERGLTTVASFSSDTTNCTEVIHPSVPGHAWVKWYKQNELHLTNREGQVVQTVKFNTGIWGLTVTPDNRMLVCSDHDKCIYQVTYGREPSVYLKTTRLRPCDICATETGDLIVSLVDSTSYTITPDSKRIVVKYDTNGRQMAFLEYDNCGQRLFIRPHKVKANSNNAIVAVVNITSKTSSQLVLLDNNLNHRLRYDGKVTPADKEYRPSEDTQFFVWDVAFTTEDIIITESRSKSILLLDIDCQVLKTLWRDDLEPSAMCLHNDGELWCGFAKRGGGVIKVLGV